MPPRFMRAVEPLRTKCVIKVPQVRLSNFFDFFSFWPYRFTAVFETQWFVTDCLDLESKLVRYVVNLSARRCVPGVVVARAGQNRRKCQAQHNSGSGMLYAPFGKNWHKSAMLSRLFEWQAKRCHHSVLNIKYIWHYLLDLGGHCAHMECIWVIIKIVINLRWLFTTITKTQSKK